MLPFIYIQFAIILLLIPLIIVALIFNYLYDSLIEKTLKEYCEEHGHHYFGKMTAEIRPFVFKTHMTYGQNWTKFGIRHSDGHKNIFTVLWFDRINTGKSSHTYIYLVTVMPLQFRREGKMYMRKEGMFDKMKNVFGVNDLDFENKTFSDKFYVASDPERFGYDFFTPRMMELCLENPRYSMLLRNNHLILARKLSNYKGIFALLSYFKKDVPLLNYYETDKKYIQQVYDRIPKVFKARNELRPEDIPAMVEPIKEGKKLTAECPECGEGFKINEHDKFITCPVCGLKGKR